ncbi:hypothetical protein WQ57_20970 [Mesobacillus campisalis]|uniref:NRDE family protein n=1 Tax=Mesobacillus campisalis TaxID=1408103 RepID=A0A0M2SR35_9BACI|nr:NRDE family protein [Mesobacillus campisalis]KKK36136.1 hypothetical protein WQ57_20970 [Mesobacillus campisalis]
MCLILFAYKSHPAYKLIVAANRDEFYQRPTAPAGYWSDQPNILAGRDLEKHGTWLGVTTSGRFAALTNYRDPADKGGSQSRGELPRSYLEGDSNPQDFLEDASRKRSLYPGYNLLAGTKDEIFYYSNRGGGVYQVPPGIHGLSNHLLNTGWPKVERGKEGLKSIVEAGADEDQLVESLLALLQNAEPAPDEVLPKTGVSAEWERVLSPLFIKTEGYGTRSSAVLLMDDQKVRFHERIYEWDGKTRDQDFMFSHEGQRG